MDCITRGPTVDEIIVAFTAWLTFTSTSAARVKALFLVMWQLKEAEHPPGDPEVASWHGGSPKDYVAHPHSVFQTSK